MIKIFSYRKIMIATLLLIFSLILFNYPTYINKPINENKIKLRNIYLLDENGYVGLYKREYNTIYDLITLLKDNNSGGTIPSDTIILNYNIQEDILNINFSKEFYNVSDNNFIPMIESIIYSVTSLNNINKICIFIEGEHLDYIPNSNKKLNYYLDRNFGINTIYDITSLNDTTSVTVYYNSNDHFIPITLISNDSSDKISIIIESLTSNRIINSNLSSSLTSNIKLSDYSNNEDAITLNFNDELFNYMLDGTLKEEVKYAISYSIYDTFGIKNVIFNINNKNIDNFRLANN